MNPRTLVTLHRVITAIVPGLSPENAEKINADALWDRAMQSGNVREKQTELLGSGPADDICPVCLSPIKVTGTGKIEIVLEEGTEIKDLRDIVVVCSKNPEHDIPKEVVNRAKRLIHEGGFA